MLSCPLCNKPLATAPAHKRHVAYCRKAQARPRVRAKACHACSLAKAKCSFLAPCQRCAERGLECVYERKAEAEPVPFEDEAGQVAVADVLEPSQRYDARDEVLQPTEDDGKTLFPALHNGLSVGLFTFVSLQRDTALAVPPQTSTFRPYLKDWTVQLSPSIPPAIQPFSNCLTRFACHDAESRASTRLIRLALRAYPIMMLRRETFPPFIHPRWQKQESGELPLALSNCMGIAQLYVARTPQTQPFLWRTVQSETHRFINEMHTFSAEDLIASSQAQTIYIIMRLFDESSLPPNLNADMVRSFIMFCSHLQKMNQVHSRAAWTSWEVWVLAQAKLRTALVFLLISLIVDTESGFPCGLAGPFDHIPLSSARMIWEAPNAEAWTAECAIYAAQTDIYNLFTLGELIAAQGPNCTPFQDRALLNWQAQIDGLGNLLNEATGLMRRKALVY